MSASNDLVGGRSYLVSARNHAVGGQSYAMRDHTEPLSGLLRQFQGCEPHPDCHGQGDHSASGYSAAVCRFFQKSSAQSSACFRTMSLMVLSVRTYA